MIYCYATRDGEVTERSFPMGKAPRTVMIKGKMAGRSFQAESNSVPPTKGWPIECVASGVNAADAQKLRDHFDSVGVKTEVSDNGNPIYTDSKYRRKALKARGFLDKASYL